MTTQGISDELAQLRDMVIRRSRLLEISVTLNSTLELDRLLDFIVESATDLLECEAASILLLEEKTQNLIFAAATGIPTEDLQSMPVPMEGSIAGTIFREDRPLIINEVAQDPRHYRQMDSHTNFSTRSLIGVPMRIRDRVTGVIEALNKKRGAFDESDLRTLEIIASQAAVALNNARLLDALQRAYDELGKLERLKSDFIAIASHELRTPLGVILGYASLLQEETGEAAAEHAAMVLNSALRMRSLIEDMTNMNLLQLASAELTLRDQPLQPVVRAAAEEVQPLLQAKDQHFSIHMPEKPIQAHIDGEKVRMALTNLLNNAMRFTPAGGHIQVEVSARGSELWLRVSDDGIGIDPEHLERIFDQFFQVEDHMTRRHGGMGLGLAIVRAISEAHGGRVWAESQGAGTGSTFTMALPKII